MRRRARWFREFCLGLSLVATACAGTNNEDEFVGLGIANANSEPPPGLMRPISPEDLVQVHDRGRRLHQLERALVLAYEQGMHQVGDPGTDAVMPLVDVDPGGRSAQVVFVRWLPDQEGNLPELSSRTAERWLLVSLLMSPDKILDVEILNGPVPEGSHAARRIDTVIAAAGMVRTEAPGTVFHLHDVYEEVLADPDKPAKGKAVQSRVYALSSDGSGPDLELVINPPTRRKDAQTVSSTLVHEGRAALGDPIVVKTTNPNPITVTRAMLRGSEAGTIGVESTGGKWSVVAGSGLLQRSE
ncbi:MAG: hypothetical protein AAF799_01695 [Myxococcota bacterium]